jgi:hypothetical protein
MNPEVLCEVAIFLNPIRKKISVNKKLSNMAYLNPNYMMYFYC